MTESTRVFNGWRIAGWGALGALLVLPAIAMRVTEKVVWTASDFVFAAIILAALGIGGEIALRVGKNAPQRVGIGIAALGGFLTVWVNGAVGMLGSENEATNLAFIGLVGAGIVLSFAVWFRPAKMRWIVAALSAGQFAVGIAAGLWTMPGHAIEWGVLAFFALIWGVSAACFHAADKRLQV